MLRAPLSSSDREGGSIIHDVKSTLRRYWFLVAFIAFVPVGWFIGRPEISRAQLEAILADGHRLGAEDALVEMVVFNHYGCGFCQQLHGTLSDLLRRYPGKLAIIVKPFYNPAFDEGSQFFIGAECAADQGAFAAYHFAAFENVRALRYWNGGQLVADSAGVPDRASFARCLEVNPHADRLQSDWTLAQTFDIQRTPTILVDGMKIEGAPPADRLEDLLVSLIDETNR